MSKQLLNLGATANDNTGDTLRAGGDKVNDNFNELYSSIGNGLDIQINVTNAGVGQVLRYNGNTFIPSDYTNLTAALDVNGNSIISTNNGNINIAANGTGNITLGAGGLSTLFSGADGNVTIPSKVSYKNEYTTLSSAPAAATHPGYFYTVDGDDNPYVNINITANGVGDVRAKLITEYSSINDLLDVDTTTAPTNDQVLKWNSGLSKWVPGDDASGIASLSLYNTFDSDNGSATASTQSDTLTIAGGNDITTSVTGDTLTIDFNGNIITTLTGLTDTDFTGIVQGNSLYWNGIDWVVSQSPVIWWDLNADGTSNYTFSGPGFPSPANDPTLYVYRGFTYIFDNSLQGGAHPFRIQSTQGLTGNPYLTGQSGSGSNILYWTVPMDAPSVLYYQCTLHSLMNGTINVVG